MKETDAYLFGRKTYQIMAAHWPTAPADDPFAGHLNGTPKYVASRTLSDLAWQNSTLLEGDVADAVRSLKQEPGGSISVLGSGQLVQTLLANDLVDELWLTVSPIVLGSGKRLFRDPALFRKLELVEATPTPKGNVVLVYRPLTA